MTSLWTYDEFLARKKKVDEANILLGITNVSSTYLDQLSYHVIVNARINNCARVTARLKNLNIHTLGDFELYREAELLPLYQQSVFDTENATTNGREMIELIKGYGALLYDDLEAIKDPVKLEYSLSQIQKGQILENPAWRKPSYNF